MKSFTEQEKLHEECAVFGVSVSTDEAAGITYNGLFALQHRGQEGAGIAVLDGNTLKYHKDVGLVSEVFHTKALERLPKAHIAVGHNRYSTTGSNVYENVQPFITEYLTGRLATVHNGNITNDQEIRAELTKRGVDFGATSDSEVIASLIAYHTMQEKNAEKGVIMACKEIKGAFSLIVLSSEKKLIAIRDANGFRPLCLGQNESGMVVASESCAIDSCGFHFVRDIEPGEMVVIQNGKITRDEKVLFSDHQSMCIFEYVYFARPDSILDGLSVYQARINMGRVLAKESYVEADLVCGAPDSGLEAAMGYARESGIEYGVGFSKNRYIGRSFIYPTQSQRENAVRLKLNPLRASVNGKRVILVDDSIVRGTTSAKVVRMLKDAGATEVHMRISSPPFRHTCLYGTDIDKEENLIANQVDNIEQICKKIGADSLAFISMEGLRAACKECKVGFCTRCFTGEEK